MTNATKTLPTLAAAQNAIAADWVTALHATGSRP